MQLREHDRTELVFGLRSNAPENDEMNRRPITRNCPRSLPNISQSTHHSAEQYLLRAKHASRPPNKTLPKVHLQRPSGFCVGEGIRTEPYTKSCLSHTKYLVEEEPQPHTVSLHPWRMTSYRDPLRAIGETSAYALFWAGKCRETP